MTIALAIACGEGIVMAADSQQTLLTDGYVTKQDTNKFYVLGGRIAWAGSGAIGAIQRVALDLEKHDEEILGAFAHDRELGAQEVFGRVNAVQKKVLEEAVGPLREDSGSDYLFAGYDPAGPFLLEINSDGSRQWNNSPCFAAIGSGALFAVHAYRSTSHYRLPSTGLVQVQALAYRTVENAINTAAMYLGGAIRLAVVTPAGASILDEDELKAVQDTMEIWKDREVEIFETLGSTCEEPPTGVEAAGAEPPSE